MEKHVESAMFVIRLEKTFVFLPINISNACFNEMVRLFLERQSIVPLGVRDRGQERGRHDRLCLIKEIAGVGGESESH